LIQDVVLEVHEILEVKAIRHAFGGALALDQYAEPRGTIDVDVNVAVAFEDAASLVATFGSAGFVASDSPAEWLVLAGVRLTRNLDTLDLFFAFDSIHELILSDAQLHPFKVDGKTYDLPFLTANDLVVMKLSFNRLKDWADIESIVFSGNAINIDLIEERLVKFRGPTMYPRVARLRKICER